MTVASSPPKPPAVHRRTSQAEELCPDCFEQMERYQGHVGVYYYCLSCSLDAGGDWDGKAEAVESIYYVRTEEGLRSFDLGASPVGP